MAVCRDYLQKEVLLLNFIGQILVMVTYHFTYESQILYQSAVFSLQFHMKSWQNFLYFRALQDVKESDVQIAPILTCLIIFSVIIVYK
jgi:hypothetical protein